ncbi:tryptophan synthase beta subunit-like PLP-dependent enzyme [Setomelanomma holmii]|uniref:L-serine ammonia-lyase n=1 Tax=Setomelanomma holmii TaxID=210430 RepID=A0A9P4H213_9PLEO|nr:tryptophan synthase beta subunit-like PLP-dependent enzyme [Setomelanomma holmii]
MAHMNGEWHALPRPWRKTPLIHSRILTKHAGCQIYLKLETLQPSGSFKSRGIGNFLLTHLQNSPSNTKPHFYSSSGGNAGLACVHAAVTLGCPSTIMVPLSTSAYMISKLRAAGASDVIQYGESWYEADSHLRQDVIPAAKHKGEDAVYVPPFDAQEIWDGHATLAGEVLEQMKDDGTGDAGPDVLVCSVGGGGLFCGIMQGLDSAGRANTRVLAVETKGADSFALSLRERELSTLPRITSIATTLGSRTVAAKAFEYGMRDNVTSVVLSDDEAIEACVRFADDERTMVEPACGVSLALCYNGGLKRVVPGLKEQSKVVLVVCGGSGVNVEMLHKWASQLEKR